MSEAITKKRAPLEKRLRLLVKEYLAECNPQSWPKPIDGIAAQQQRYWAKRHAQELLKEMNSLQQLLRNAPRIAASDDSSEGQELIRKAKQRGAELREQFGLTAPKESN